MTDKMQQIITGVSALADSVEKISKRFDVMVDSKRRADALPSRNRRYGYFGGNQDEPEPLKKKKWKSIFDRVSSLTGETNQKKIRDFLDSSAGRHIHDQEGSESQDREIVSWWKHFNKSYDPRDFKNNN